MEQVKKCALQVLRNEISNKRLAIFYITVCSLCVCVCVCMNAERKTQ